MSNPIYFSRIISGDVASIFVPNEQRYNRTYFAQHFGFPTDKLAIPEHVHSSVVSLAEKPGNYFGADGLITVCSNVILSLKVADCVPVYLYEPYSHMIGLIHAGWKSTALGIIPKSIKLMQKYGAEIEFVKVYLGPAIGICCYEVDEDVAMEFDDSAKMESSCMQSNNDFNKNISNKWKIDLHKQIMVELLKCKLKINNIKKSPICTFEMLDYHSYRRDGTNAGRMFGFMRLND